MMQDVLDVALLVAKAIDATGSEYFVGGSVASSLQGEPRATNDIDFVVTMLGLRVRRAVDQESRGHDPAQAALVRGTAHRGTARHRGDDVRPRNLPSIAVTHAATTSTRPLRRNSFDAKL